MHIQRVHAQRLGAGDVGVAVVANHQTVFHLQSLLVDQRLIELGVGLTAQVIRRNIDSIQLFTQPQQGQLIGGEHPLGIAQQPQPAALGPQPSQRIQSARVQPHILQRANPEQLRCIEAQAAVLVRHAPVAEQLGHNLLKGDVGETFVALSRLGFPAAQLLPEGFLQTGSGDGGTVEAEEKGGFFPNQFIFLGMNVHQSAVKIKD